MQYVNQRRVQGLALGTGGGTQVVGYIKDYLFMEDDLEGFQLHSGGTAAENNIGGFAVTYNGELFLQSSLVYWYERADSKSAPSVMY